MTRGPSSARLKGFRSGMNASGGIGVRADIQTDSQYYSFDRNWWQSSSKTEKRVSDLIELMDCPRRGERTAGEDSNLKTCSVDWDNKLSSRAYLWDYAALVTAGRWLGYCPGIKRNLRQRQAKIIISIESTNKMGKTHMVLWVRDYIKLISSDLLAFTHGGIILEIMAISKTIEGIVKMYIYCSHSDQLYL